MYVMYKNLVFKVFNFAGHLVAKTVNKKFS